MCKRSQDRRQFSATGRFGRGRRAETVRGPLLLPGTDFTGRVELLVKELSRSEATWKVIQSDMPIGLIVPDGPVNIEAVAQGDGGAPLGRELQIA